ncbi:MAG: hypothetical protein ACRCUS_03870, partial [Anaerovoracaceae bacterium]
MNCNIFFKKGQIIFLGAIIAFALPAFASAAITDAKTPIKIDYGQTKWQLNLKPSLGGVLRTPNPPAVDGDYIYVASDKTKHCKVYKINKNTGITEKTSIGLTGKDGKNANLGYATIPIEISDDGKTLFVPLLTLKGPFVIAMNSDNLQVLWKSSYLGVPVDTSNGSDIITPIKYDNEKIFFGTWWASPSQQTNKGAYYCISTASSDSGIAASPGSVIWDYEIKDGYYWAGAYVSKDKDYLIFGGEDKKLRSVKKSDGALISEIYLAAKIRSTPAFENGNVYLTTTGKKLNKISVDDTGNLSLIKSLSLDNYAVNTPVVYNGVAYFGTVS